VRVVQEGSFTAAGNSLGIGPSSVSKKVARLEKQLGVLLLSRTTRRLALTEAGQEFFNRCSTGLLEISRAEDVLQEHLEVPRGLLRLKVARGFGRSHISPLIPKFVALYPAIEVDAAFGNWEEHVMDAHIDVIISAADPPNINLVSRTLMYFERLTCASPTYIKRHGKPKEPKDLVRHNCLIFTDSGSVPNEWTYHRRDGIEHVRVSGNFRTNSPDAQHYALMEGLGIAHIPSFVIENEIASGRLEVIFRDTVQSEARAPAMKAYYAPAKFRLPKIKLFVDFLTSSLRNRYGQEERERLRTKKRIAAAT
jgi:DNA-binding transcriptional LysR family regulator